MIRIGLYGSNGHQIFHALENHPFARIDAVAGVPDETLADLRLDTSRIRILDSFTSLIADDELDMISLCSPRRRDQADHAVEAMRHGKHVLAEKPCAMTEQDLDRIIHTSADTGRCFHEMAGTAFDFPYNVMRETVLAGTIGDVIQVIAEKSYPYHSGRPADRDIDGGLIGQNMIHALRLVEHVASVPITSLDTLATTSGLPTDANGPHMAASILAVLKNGGIASLSANYLNPKGTGVWGDDSLRILGTLGMLESRNGGQLTRLVVGDHDHGPLKPESHAPTWLDMMLRHVASREEMPLPLEVELSPTRWAIRATEGCKAQLGNLSHC
jgi:predicted dehydrogenase